MLYFDDEYFLKNIAYLIRLLNFFFKCAAAKRDNLNLAKMKTQDLYVKW